MILNGREASGARRVEWIGETVGDGDNYDGLEKLVFERTFYVASWTSCGSMTSGGVDWDGFEVRGSVYWRMSGDTDDAGIYNWSYNVNDHARREAAYDDLNWELKIAHYAGSDDGDSEDDPFEPATWEKTIERQ